MEKSTAASCTAQLADFIYETQGEDMPVGMQHELKRSLMNYFAVSLAGCNDPTTDIVVRTFSPFSAGSAGSLIGRTERMDILHAAAINALAANVYDYDDTHIPTIIHPTAPVAAALLAYGESNPIPGRAFMVALLLGIETQCRIGLAISPFHYSRGWHITSTCGVFGSAMALGKILGLLPNQLGWALGTAACQAGGLVESLGTMSKSMSVGNAARNGMLSALLAKEGFDGPARPLEGDYGFTRVFGQSPDLSAITNDLGSTWQLSNVAYKPYPCGVVLNPVLDAALDLAGQLTPEDICKITAIEITGHPLLKQRTDRPGVSSGRESQVSAQHAVPVALLRKSAGLTEFSDTAVNDPAVKALGTRVRFIEDGTYSIESAKVTLHLHDKRTMEKHIAIAKGSLARPLTDDELETKLRDLCKYGASGCDPNPLIAALWELETLDDISLLPALAVAKT